MQLILIGALIGVLLMTNFAYARATTGDKTANYAPANCYLCHGDSSADKAYGPHGGYTTVSNNCKACHTIHSNSISSSSKVAVNAQLLPGATVTATCQFCHDLTTSELAPYSTLYMGNSSDVKAAHRVPGIASYNNVIQGWDGYNKIPGGDPTTGGSATFTPSQGTLSGDTLLTCDSCHTPHGLNTVRPYLGESRMKVLDLGGVPPKYGDQTGYKGYYLTNRLLKNKLQVGSAVYTEYGSAWCAGCHQGRTHTLGDGNFNHPVNESSPAYDWGHIANDSGALINGATVDDAIYGSVFSVPGRAPIAVVVSAPWYAVDPTKLVKFPLRMKTGIAYPSVLPIFSEDPRRNTMYTMTASNFDGVPFPDGYQPIGEYPDGPVCQQCHASARQVEQMFSDGNPWSDSFPHISKNGSLLIEENDNLCTNCHGADNLP